VSDEQQVDFHLLWDELGQLALAGKLPLKLARWMCCLLIVAASSRRNKGVKTYVADELQTSRRTVRHVLRAWVGGGEGRGLLAQLRGFRIDVAANDRPR